jgi:hypothetical protein
MPAAKNKLSLVPLGCCIHTGANAGKKQASANGPSPLWVWPYLVWSGLISFGLALSRLVWPHLVWSGLISSGLASSRLVWPYLVWSGLISSDLASSRLAKLLLMPEANKPKRLGSALTGQISKPPSPAASGIKVLRTWRRFRIRQ